MPGGAGSLGPLGGWLPNAAAPGRPPALVFWDLENRKSFSTDPQKSSLKALCVHTVMVSLLMR